MPNHTLRGILIHFKDQINYRMLNSAGMQELSHLQIVYVVVFCLQSGVFLLLNEWLMETDAFT